MMTYICEFDKYSAASFLKLDLTFAIISLYYHHKNPPSTWESNRDISQFYFHIVKNYRKHFHQGPTALYILITKSVNNRCINIQRFWVVPGGSIYVLGATQKVKLHFGPLQHVLSGGI